MLAGTALDRFVEAQDPIYAEVCAELAAGNKRSHWMWFVFPQLRGLGSSAMAIHYGLASQAETIAYWQHPVLRQRLTECTQLVLAVQNKTLLDIFGKPDDMKFRSCMTLFDCSVAGEPLFTQALSRYCDGKRDERTLALLA
jgi:uncharacterized protein (DUF1810 family)